MRFSPVREVDELDERHFPLAFVGRCVAGQEASVFVRVFDPADGTWHAITLEQWRFVLELARTLH